MAFGDHGQRLARLDLVDLPRWLTRRRRSLAALRWADLRRAEQQRRPCLAPDDAVRREPGLLLELAHLLLGHRAELAVQRLRREAAAREQELEHGHVESEHAALQHAGPEAGSAELAERGARLFPATPSGASPADRCSFAIRPSFAAPRSRRSRRCSGRTGRARPGCRPPGSRSARPPVRRRCPRRPKRR